MKSFKYLLALPLLVTSLTACGGSDKFTPVDYTKAASIVENYATSVKNSKAAGIAVSGHINKINIKGDATWWSAELPDDAEGIAYKTSLLSMIPNFSLKDGEINIDPQDIATFNLPASLTAIAETYLSSLNTSGTEKKTMFLVLANLPKFPMNNHLLQLLNGFESIPEDEGGIKWEEIKYKKWEFGTVKYFSNAGKIKVNIETEDIESFMWEINNRLGETDPYEEPEKAYPGSFSLTTNKIGYVDSLSVKVTFKEEKFEKETDRYYIYLNGDIDVDLSLKFKQTISDPITVKYQVTEYKRANEDESVDNTYTHFPVEGSTTTETINLHKNKVTDITTSLKDLSQYVTFDWMSNLEVKTSKDGSKETRTLTKIYDDPIFEYNYWKDNEKNIAFLNQTYDVLVLPAMDTNKKATYQILGAEPHGYGAEQPCPSLNSVSVDGRLVSDSNGIPERASKILTSAADVMTKHVTIIGEDGKEFPNKYNLNEVFINSNVLESRKSECVVNISVMKLGQ